MLAEYLRRTAFGLIAAYVFACGLVAPDSRRIWLDRRRRNAYKMRLTNKGTFVRNFVAILVSQRTAEGG